MQICESVRVCRSVLIEDLPAPGERRAYRMPPLRPDAAVLRILPPELVSGDGIPGPLRVVRAPVDQHEVCVEFAIEGDSRATLELQTSETYDGEGGWIVHDVPGRTVVATVSRASDADPPRAIDCIYIEMRYMLEPQPLPDEETPDP